MSVEDLADKLISVTTVSPTSACMLRSCEMMEGCMLWFEIIMLHHLWNLTNTAPELSRSDYFLGLYLVAARWTSAATSFSSCLQPCSRAWHPWGLTCVVGCMKWKVCMLGDEKNQIQIQSLSSSKHKSQAGPGTLRWRMLSCLRVLMIFSSFCFATSICIFSTLVRSHF